MLMKPPRGGLQFDVLSSVLYPVDQTNNTILLGGFVWPYDRVKRVKHTNTSERSAKTRAEILGCCRGLARAVELK